MPYFMLRSMFLHAYMFRSTCLGFYAMFPLFRSSFCFMLKLGLCAHMLDIMSMVMLCSDLCLYAFCHVLCLDQHPYMLICLNPCSTMRVVMPMPRSTS